MDEEFVVCGYYSENDIIYEKCGDEQPKELGKIEKITKNNHVFVPVTGLKMGEGLSEIVSNFVKNYNDGKYR